MLSEEEFYKRLSLIPGIRIEGDTVYGVRLITESERKIRHANAQRVGLAVCSACGADERSCSGSCLLFKNNLAMNIARMVPEGVSLREVIPMPRKPIPDGGAER
jgi:hypothetical protein